MLYKVTAFASVIAGANAFQAGMPLSISAPRASLQQVVMAAKQTPHGGVLVNTFAEESAVADLVKSADKTIEMTDRQSCDVELLNNGGLSPLTGFLNEESYTSVVETMKLPDGNILGLPIVMDTNDESVSVGDKILLTYKGTDMALMTVESKWSPDKPLECIKCYGTATIDTRVSAWSPWSVASSTSAARSPASASPRVISRAPRPPKCARCCRAMPTSSRSSAAIRCTAPTTSFSRVRSTRPTWATMPSCLCTRRAAPPRRTTSRAMCVTRRTRC